MGSGNGIHVVLGASGGTGGAVVRALADRGRHVRAVNSKGDAQVPTGVERVGADLTKPQDARRAVEGAAVVYHCAQPAYTRWARDFPVMNGAIVQAVAEAGARLVFADNLYAYGPVHGRMTEDMPPRATGKKGALRARMAEELLSAHRDGRLRVTIGRASDYFGPGGVGSSLGEHLFGAAVRGRKARWFGALDRPHTASFTEDIGRAIATLGERPQADGRIWHLPAAEPVTGQEFLDLLQAAAGRPLDTGVISPGMMRLAGVFVPMARELSETMYQWTEPFVADWSRFERAFGPFGVTPLGEAIARTVGWFRARTAGARAA